jgi:hypothetical protein
MLAAVERKTLEDYIHSLVDGSLPFALSELAGLPSAVVVVEGRYSQLLAAPRVQPGWLAELRLQSLRSFVTGWRLVSSHGNAVPFAHGGSLALDMTYAGVERQSPRVGRSAGGESGVVAAHGARD